MRTFTNPLFNPYMAFRAAGFENDSVLGPSRTTSPYFSCSLMWVSSGRRFQTSTNRHQSVNEAKKGPGYLFRPWRNRFLASHATSNTPTTVVQCCSSICNTSSVIPCILSLLKGWGGGGDVGLRGPEAKEGRRYGMTEMIMNSQEEGRIYRTMVLMRRSEGSSVRCHL